MCSYEVPIDKRYGDWDFQLQGFGFRIQVGIPGLGGKLWDGMNLVIGSPSLGF